MLIKLPKVIEITTLSKSSIYRQMGCGTFPKQVKTSTRSRAWHLSDVESWIESRIIQSNNGVQS